MVDILVTGWWGSNWESASSTFWLPLLWALHACESIQSASSPWGGFSIEPQVLDVLSQKEFSERQSDR